MRLIDADALKAVFEEKSSEAACGVELCKAIIFRINKEPTVDAVPVIHGQWIDEGQYADYHPHHAWRCSECGEYVIEVDTPWYKYCPNCGAQMEKGGKDG